jgi:hypothetical protein
MWASGFIELKCHVFLTKIQSHCYQVCHTVCCRVIISCDDYLFSTFCRLVYHSCSLSWLPTRCRVTMGNDKWYLVDTIKILYLTAYCSASGCERENFAVVLKRGNLFIVFTLCYWIYFHFWVCAWGQGHTILTSCELMWCYACGWDVRGDLTLNSMVQIHTLSLCLRHVSRPTRAPREITWRKKSDRSVNLCHRIQC